MGIIGKTHSGIMAFSVLFVASLMALIALAPARPLLAGAIRRNFRHAERERPVINSDERVERISEEEAADAAERESVL